MAVAGRRQKQFDKFELATETWPEKRSSNRLQGFLARCIARARG
eukprot:SAG31_NODE_42668_length_270_cov_0.906433_1_plen_43_part_10